MTSFRQRITISAIVIGCLLGVAELSPGQASSQRPIVSEATKAYEEKRYPVAENQILEFLQKFPESPYTLDMLYLLGMTYFQQEKFRNARDVFLRLINENSQNHQEVQTNGLFWLAESSAQLKRWEEAKAYYQEYVEKNIDDPFREKSLFALGLIFFKEKSLREAEAYFSRAVVAYPNGRYRSLQQYYRGLIYTRWGDYHRAVQLLREALFSPSGLEEPLRKEALFYLAENRLKLGHFQLARPYYEGFYRTYPQDSYAPFALYGAGWCQLNTGQREPALESFQELIKQFPKSKPYPHALFRVGEIRLKEGNYEKARVAFSRVVKEFPETELAVSALVNLGWSYLNLGDFEEMTRVARRLLELPPDQPEKTLAQLLLGEAHFQRGRYKEALPYFFSLLNTPSQRENALYKISQCYFFLGEYKDAVTNVEILLLEYPNAQHVDGYLYLRGRTAYHLGDTEKAITSLSRIVERKNHNSYTVAALYDLGRIYYERKDVKQAESFFSQILRIRAEGQTAILASYHLGIIYFNQKDTTAALLHFRNALESSNRSIKAESHYRLGRLFFERQAFELSLHHFQTIVDTLTDQRNWVELALFEIGNVRRAQGDYTGAVKAFQRTLEVSKDPDIREASRETLVSIEE
jgi:TolA-binding protein